MKTSVEKATYETPQLVQHGSLEQVTQHASAGGFTDAGFPLPNVPIADLTFSG